MMIDYYKKFLTKIKNKFYLVEYLYFFNLEDELIENLDSELTLLNQEHIEKLFNENPNAIDFRKKKILKKRLSFDEVKDFTFLKDNHVVGHYALAFENRPTNPYIECSLKITPLESYLFDDYTLPQYRGLGFHYKAILKRLIISKRAGYKKSLALINEFNIASQTSFEKIGFRREKKIYKIKIFKQKIKIWTTKL